MWVSGVGDVRQIVERQRVINEICCSLCRMHACCVYADVVSSICRRVSRYIGIKMGGQWMLRGIGGRLLYEWSDGIAKAGGILSSANSSSLGRRAVRGV